MKLQNWKVAGLALSLAAISFAGVVAGPDEDAKAAKEAAEKVAAEKANKKVSDLVFAIAQMAEKDEKLVAARKAEADLIKALAGLQDKEKVKLDTGKYVKDETNGKEVSAFKAEASAATVAAGDEAFRRVVDHAKASDYYKGLKPSEKSCFSKLCDDVQTSKFWIGDKKDGRWMPFLTHTVPAAGIVSLSAAAAYYYKNTENPTVSGYFAWLKDGFMNLVGMTEVEVEDSKGKVTKTQRGGPSAKGTGISLGAFVAAAVAVPAALHFVADRDKPAAV